MKKRDFINDILVRCELNGDYTIKIFKTRRGKYYSSIVHETETDSKEVGCTTFEKSDKTAFFDAITIIENFL